MNKLTDSFKLKNGVEIPCVGFGTWQAADGEECYSSVLEALRAGYRHIDTAAVYGNEESVGRAMKDSGVPRGEIFLTTKVWNTERGYDKTAAAFEVSAKKLGVDTVDLYLIHWPNPAPFRDSWAEQNAETWRAIEDLYEAGRIRAIGISNFLPHHIDALLKTARIAPLVNQVRFFPGFPQEEISAYCDQKGIFLEAYSPLGTGKLLSSPELGQVAEKYCKSPAQVCIRWCLQMGVLPLPKSVTPSRIRENTEVFDFELSEDDVDMLKTIPNPCGPGNHPDETSF